MMRNDAATGSYMAPTRRIATFELRSSFSLLPFPPHLTRSVIARGRVLDHFSRQNRVRNTLS